MRKSIGKKFRPTYQRRGERMSDCRGSAAQNSTQKKMEPEANALRGLYLQETIKPVKNKCSQKSIAFFSNNETIYMCSFANRTALK
jgi:hypothetical protein